MEYHESRIRPRIKVILAPISYILRTMIIKIKSCKTVRGSYNNPRNRRKGSLGVVGNSDRRILP